MQLVCWLWKCSFLPNTDNLAVDLTFTKCCFCHHFSVFNSNKKIWNFETPRWWLLVTSFIWLQLLWKPIRHHMVLIIGNTKNAYMCQISSQSDKWCQKWRWGVRLTLPPPPPPLMPSCNFPRLMPSRVK